MANPKRASMREGPLAALFRKTEEGEEAEGQAAESAPAARERRPEPPPHPRETGVPHPALGAREAEAEPETRIPSPQERLRHAFSSEIPENVMARPAPVTPAAAAPRYEVAPERMQIPKASP